MSENEIYKVGASLRMPYTAEDSSGAGIDGLTVKFSIKLALSGFYWNGTTFASGPEVLNTATGTGKGYYEYLLINGYNRGQGAYIIHVEATDTITGDVADKTVEQTLSLDADIEASTSALPHSVKKNTAVPGYKFAMVGATTGNLQSGFSVTATRKLDADGSWAAMTGSIVDDGDGAYSIDINAADTNGRTGVWKLTAPGARTILITFITEGL